MEKQIILFVLTFVAYFFVIFIATCIGESIKDYRVKKGKDEKDKTSEKHAN